MPREIAADRVLYYPTRAVKAVEWLMVEINPADGLPWLGLFAGEYQSPVAMRGYIALPDGGRLCVVSGGRGYIVSARDPSDFVLAECFPITDARRDAECNLVVLADFVRMSTFDRNGRSWITPRVSWNGVEIRMVTSNSIIGMGWNEPEQRKVPFAAFVESQRVEGGASPSE
jgi:hypothetical protein